jgi:hypothetical protein
MQRSVGVHPIGVATSGTAAGQVNHSLYPAHFTFPAAKIEIDFASVVGVNLTGQEVAGKRIIALIGRDVLSMGIFVYNGHTGAYTTGFSVPRVQSVFIRLSRSPPVKVL